MSAWDSFVARAVDGEPDDPFVRLLRQRLASGSRIVRAEIDLSKTTGAEYRLLLERLHELSEMRVPHSPSFTRWSLQIGLHMATTEQESVRVSLLAAERFVPLCEELGEDYAKAILLDRLRALGPPRTAGLLAGVHILPTAPGREKQRATRACDALLGGLAADLGRPPIGYTHEDATEILDAALSHFVTGVLRIEPMRASGSE